MKHVLVIAPHPDDETLGCAGVLLKLRSQGYTLHWAVAARLDAQAPGVDAARIASRQSELIQVKALLGFHQLIPLSIPAARVGEDGFAALVQRMSGVFDAAQPQIVFLPFCNDAHTDHYYTAKAALCCCKWFRRPGIESILYYETPSETNFNLNPCDTPFRPTVYADITPFWARKKEILSVYQSELGAFPFPRSAEAVKALARLRGSECGADYAEAFQLIRGVL